MADHSDFLCNSIDSFNGFTPNVTKTIKYEEDNPQFYTLEDYTPTNKSIIITFTTDYIFNEVWTSASEKYGEFLNKGENGEFVQCTEDGLKVTLTFYRRKRKLHVQGEGCELWKVNSLDHIMCSVNSGTRVDDNSLTELKQTTSTPLSGKSHSLSSKSKYLRRAAEHKGQLFVPLQKQLAEMQTSATEQRLNQNEVQRDLIEAKKKIDKLTIQCMDQSQLITSIQLENTRLKQEVSQYKKVQHTAVVEKTKLDKEISQMKINQVKANTENFFLEDKLKHLKENLLKNEKERSSMLTALTTSNCIYEELKENFEKLIVHIENIELKHTSEPQPTTKTVCNATHMSYAEMTKAPKPSKNSACARDNAQTPQNLQSNIDVDCTIPKTQPDSLENENQTLLQTTHKKTLLIGTSILKYVSRRGLLRHVDISTNRGAMIPKIREVLQNLPIGEYDTIIIHAGSNDASQGIPIADIMYEYRSVLNFIYSHNANMKVIISGLTPRCDVNVRELNAELKDMCHSYGLIFIENYEFFAKRQDLFNRDGIHLNRKGTSQLLRNVDSICPILKWSKRQKRTSSQQEQSCFFCGETGHSSKVCFHGTAVQCWNCGLHGHKIKSCMQNQDPY